MLDKAGESSYNNRAKQSRYGITHLTPAQQVTGGSDGNFPIELKGFILCGCCASALFCFCISVFKFLNFLEVFSIATTTHEINEQIRDPQVRLISEEGEQLGIVSAEEALRIATEAGYDLVKIAPNSVPPVCRIMDYGKFRFEQTKKEKEAKKNQRVIEIKEIRMSPGIDTNDFNTKLKNAQKFLGDGDRVKVSVRFRGREMAHTEIGADLLKDFAEKCAEIANMDKAPKLEGRNMSMFLSPKPAAPAKKPAKPKQPKQTEPSPAETPAEVSPADAE